MCDSYGKPKITTLKGCLCFMPQETDRHVLCCVCVFFHRDSIEEDVGQGYGHSEEEICHSSEDEDDRSSNSSKGDQELSEHSNVGLIHFWFFYLIQMYLI